MANASICNNIPVNFNSHKLNSSKEIFKPFDSKKKTKKAKLKITEKLDKTAYLNRIYLRAGCSKITDFKKLTVETGSAPSDSCSCPASGHWNITSSDTCTLSSNCTLSAGDLHIVDGSLTIVNGVTLAIPSGYKAIIDKANGGSLVIENGGKLVIEK